MIPSDAFAEDPYGLVGVILGYAALGQPLLAFTYERVFLTVRLLPYLGGAAVVLLGLEVAVRLDRWTRRFTWLATGLAER